jgi:hypothetical protein
VEAFEKGKGALVERQFDLSSRGRRETSSFFVDADVIVHEDAFVPDRDGRVIPASTRP